MNTSTLVIGASENENRYSNLAIRKLSEKNIHVIALGLRKGKIGNVIIETEKKPFKNIDTVTLYINPIQQKMYYEYIINLKPNRVIFNPGTENSEFEKLLSKNKINYQIACTLVLLSINQY
ncbi:CoA-binding protein [Tenacibaculum sp. UWU-22]|uniref:CoA-binding protein n=1 Tax=Tenacibaculum sp. UWU-22 TaxID=3234187 RepID=UPI0034DB237E